MLGNRPTRVLVHGLAHFAQRFPSMLQSDGWDIRSYDLRRLSSLISMTRYLQRCDLAFSWTGRITMGKFLFMSRLLRKKKMVLFWCGSDVLFAQNQLAQRKNVDPWIAEKVHWAGAPWLAEEVRLMGLPCEYVPITWVRPVVQATPLPQKFSVLCYAPTTDRFELYGIDQVLEVARSMPAVGFTLVGLLPGQKLSVPDNVHLHEWTADMTRFYQNATVVWRPTRHDGMSFMALEALAHGRHVIWSYPSPGVVQSREANTARIALQRLLDLHRDGRLALNQEGSDFVKKNFSPDIIRNGMLAGWRKIIESPSPMPSSFNAHYEPISQALKKRSSAAVPSAAPAPSDRL